MRAKITADGCLVVQPDTETEAYALGEWKKSYFDWFRRLGPHTIDCDVAIHLDASMPEERK